MPVMYVYVHDNLHIDTAESPSQKKGEKKINAITWFSFSRTSCLTDQTESLGLITMHFYKWKGESG